MKKNISGVFIATVLIQFLGCVKNLTRADINNMNDKSFYVVDVVVGHQSDKGMLVFGIGVKDKSVKRDALLALPVEQMSKVLADDLKIKIDITDYRGADLKAITSNLETLLFSNYGSYLGDALLWQSGKKNVNRVIIKYLLREEQDGWAIGFDVYLKMVCEIDIITSTGAKKTITMWIPANGKDSFNPEEIAKKKGIPVEEATRAIVLEEIAKLPARLKYELAKVN